MKIFLVLAVSVSISVTHGDPRGHRIKKRFAWREETNLYWAENCDWNNNDLSNAKIPGEQCGSKCAQTPGCTHFTWTDYEGGTCWMKKNAVNKDQAQYRQAYSVCGLMKSGGSPSASDPLSEVNVFKKTIWAEARGEPEEGQKWVAWVIKNRAARNKEYWGGPTIKGVCLKPGQFECWNGKMDIKIEDQASFDRISSWADTLINAPQSEDPTGGCDHYNNPDKEGSPPWTNNVLRVRKIASHQFYKSKALR